MDVPPDAFDADDVEILEVVGVEDDAVDSVSPSEAAEPIGDSEEFLLGFDDDDDPDSLGVAPPPGATVDLDDEQPAGVEGDPGAESDRRQLLRLRADYDNLRKRIGRERDEFELHANAALVGRLLPVLDNLERAMAAGVNTDQTDVLREGLVMIHGQLTEELRREGLRAIVSVGQPFDPQLHDAVATDPDSDRPANEILEEFQRGYLFHDRVLRHAMVRVSTNGFEQKPSDDSEGSQ